MEMNLVVLLRLLWTAGIVPFVLVSLPLPFDGLLHRLLMEIVARGKIKGFTASEPWSSYSTITSNMIGGSNTFSFDKAHSPTLSQKFKAWQTVFLLLLMEIQVLRRLHETMNVFHYSPSARMHIFSLFIGLFFYVMAPLSLASPCIIEVVSFLHGQIAEFTVKGRDSMPDLRIDPPGLVKPLFSLGWCQWVGATIFFWGWLHQLRCHSILGSLRENRGADEYIIPYGDWFKYVSCPHYFAEIIIYVGILAASGGYDITLWLLFIFVVANLSFAAAETHRWYKQKFEDYPRTRQAIIPFVY
ncbi:3-oxo-5-alpha-steroid 4-dehydrogenase family protein [Rhynchospora pubera]|uniref:3-oxo-5-alpha-steroid 4-dehydrogenase family protein n=1 Tax=Rhynchospora pubera TaxID=906938 RepID=A0AAV8H7C9_9POAL|nr:3-oxo-5-alpha-steroid 4-dehydrogenase family protein [Rhynchospora pubera]